MLYPVGLTPFRQARFVPRANDSNAFHFEHFVNCCAYIPTEDSLPKVAHFNHE